MRILRGATHSWPNIIYLHHATVVGEHLRSIAIYKGQWLVARLVLEPLNLGGKVVLADALHTQDETARQIIHHQGGDDLLTVKKNQPTLYETLELNHCPPPLTGVRRPSELRPPSSGRQIAELDPGAWRLRFAGCG